MLKERRDWIQKYRADFGKVPDNLDKFYERHDLLQPLSPEEEEKKAAEDEENAKKGGKEKKGGKGKGGKGKGKGAAPADEGGAKKMKIGPSEVVGRFDEFYEEYNKDWANRDEHENKKQAFDRNMARDEVMPTVEKELKKEVDEAIKMELETLKTQLHGAKKKKKGKKKKKKGKKKKKKALKLPGAAQLRDMSEYDMLVELVKIGIVKKLQPAQLKEFIGEFNYVAMLVDKPDSEPPREPSMALIRQLVTEYIIFPLGSALVRKRFPEHCRSYLFYGPAGTGKTQVVRAIVSETRSVLFDLSPLSIQNVYNSDKKETEKLVAMVMLAAKEYQPSVIYIDEVEKVFPGGKKGKKKKKRSKGSDMQNPKRIAKALNKWRPKFITDEVRITIIGCTSEPQEGSRVDFKKNFDRAIYFPFPDYATRRLMWKTFIEQSKGKLTADFPLSTLAHISAGYSAGSIKKTCESVLTNFRKTKLDVRPLSLQEFIGPLSLCSQTMADQWADLKKFTSQITGDEQRLKLLRQQIDPDEGGDNPKKGKKGGKKKKK